MTRYLLDTNMLWWYFVKSSSHHDKVKPYLDQLILNTENFFYINEFAVIELFHLLIKRKGREGFKIASGLLDRKYPFLTIVFSIEDRQNLRSLLDELNQYGMTSSIGGRDASLLHTLDKYRITDIITDDRGFEEVEGLDIHNPLMS